MTSPISPGPYTSSQGLTPFILERKYRPATSRSPSPLENPPELRDLVDEARNGTMLPTGGIAKEVHDVACTLLNRDRNHVYLKGPQGSGKTTVIEGLALAIATGEVPQRLLGLKIIDVNHAANMSSEIKTREIIRLLFSEPTHVLFIDKPNKLSHPPNFYPEFLTALLKNFSMKRTSVILCSDDSSEEAEIIKQTGSHYQTVTLLPPNREGCEAMIMARLKAYEVHHNCTFTKDAILQIIQSLQINPLIFPKQELPARLFMLIDHAGSCIEARGSQPTSDVIGEDLSRPKITRSDINEIVSQLIKKSATSVPPNYFN